MSNNDALHLDPSSNGGFDPSAIGAAIGFPPVLDWLGRLRWSFPSCELTIVPLGAEALCNVALVDDGKVRQRSLRLPTPGAILLAKAVVGLTHCRDYGDEFGDTCPTKAGRYVRMVIEFPFADAASVACAPAVGEVDFYARGEEATFSDVLRPWALRREFRFGEVTEGVAAEGHLGLAAVEYPLAAVGFALRLRDGRVTGSQRHSDWRDESPFRLPPDFVLVLLGVQEGLEHFERAEYDLRDFDPSALVLKRRLRALERAALGGDLDAVDGHRRLTELFDPAGFPPAAATMPAWQRNAIATMAMRTWLARGICQPPLAVDLNELAAVAGSELTATGGEYALRCPAGDLEFRVERGVAIGHARLLDEDEMLFSRPFAMHMATLEWLVWGLAGAGELGRATPKGLTKFVRTLLLRPEVPAEPSTRPAIEELEVIPAAYSILERRPS